MRVNMASQNSSFGAMNIGNRRANPLAAGLSVKSAAPMPNDPSDTPKGSIYSKFEQEMARRFNEAAKRGGSPERNEDDTASALLQSLSGALGEVEELFGRQGATEMMAGILSGTADGVTEKSLLSSIQTSLTSLSRLDPNESKVKRLTASFNKDLSLALDQDLADEKLQSKQTLSLSYALARHFASPDAADENKLSDENTGDKTDGEGYAMRGFDETGAWGSVDVAKPDENAAMEIREAAEAGLNKAVDLTMADITKQDPGSGIFQNLANFLEDNLQDEESAAFVNQCILDSSLSESSSPKMAQMLGQVYSKVASDGDADKLAVFESYINNDFKNALNPILSAMPFLPEDGAAEELGAVQFKGLGGVSLGGENDVFSLNFGYQEDNSYDRSIAKRFLQEDIHAVKAVKKNNDAAEQEKMAKAWDDSPEERRLEESKKSAPQESDIQKSTLAEKFEEEQQQDKLEEAMGLKFGQLSDSSREGLEQYISDNFSEEEAQKLLEHSKWNNGLMNGLAAIHQDIRESGDDKKALGFINFLNGSIKKEVDKFTEKLGGLTFNGWQSADNILSELSASFKFNGQESANIAIRPAPQMGQGPGEDNKRKLGYLIDLMA